MIKCPNCGNQINENINFCPVCGQRMVLDQVHPEPVQKKSSLNVVILVLSIVLATIVIVIGFFVWSSNQLTSQEQQKIQAVEASIEKVESDDSDFNISTAEKMYDGLDDKSKKHVKNYKILKNARVKSDKENAKAVADAISKIGDITADKCDEIKKVKDSYDALTKSQKKYVDNYDDLKKADDKVSDLRVKDVTAKIDDIGDVSVDSGKKIKDAESAYSELNEKEKKQIKNHDKLKNARTSYEQFALDDCINAINAIGNVTLDSANAIDEAKNKYDSLSETTKSKVTNSQVLTEAENQLKQLKADEELKRKTLNPGDSFDNGKWSITYIGNNISAKILPDDTSGYYNYMYADDDSTYIDLKFKIKNIDTDILGIEDLVGTCQVIYDGTTLNKSYHLFLGDGSSVDNVYSWDGIDALDTGSLHVGIIMPREVQSDGKSITVKLNIGGSEKIFNIR